jgi:UDP-N-acetylglucosamine/UDP-N-acetylgalactosamine diphosphorylase
MPLPGPTDLDPVLLEAYRTAGQGHVFRFWPELDAARRESLARQAATVDLPLLTRLTGEAGSRASAPPDLAPFQVITRGAPDRPAALATGRAMLGRGAVGFVTVAGGQATRLGIGPPKGVRPVGPVSGKTLFQWHAEKVRAASGKYGRPIPWVIMTSEANALTTEEFFEAEGWFGLEGRVRFIRQRMLPAVDGAGRIILENPGRIAMSPNGHGGAIEALARDGGLDWFARLGIDTLSYFQVDNALINPADPVFLGYQELREAEMSAKVVRKRDPLEKAGVVALLDGRPGVLEYTELPEDLARATGADGELRFGWANIAAHVFTRDFLERMQDRPLPWHRAVKPVPGLDPAGRPTRVEASKFETFIFDAIPEARGFIAFETDREEEFAPLKNAEGENSPATVHAALLARSRRWYAASGREPPSDPDLLEIAPLSAYDLETFVDLMARTSGGESR